MITSGTLLRKHIATTCIALNLTETEVDDLANFVGHANKINCDHYRIPITQRGMVHFASLLEKTQGIFSKPEPGKIIQDTDSENEECCHIVQRIHKKRNPPYLSD